MAEEEWECRRFVGGIIDLLDINLSTWGSVLSIIKEHPDWDNEQVVDEADWDDDFDEE